MREDFASAAMVRALRDGMRALGLAVPAQPPSAHAQVRLDVKRALVESAVRQGGLACLPRLGAGLHAHGDDPTHRALTAARDAPDLLERWRRLERYVHSTHRTTIEAVGENEAVIRHLSTVAGAAPSAAEDLVVIGVLGALMQAAGVEAPRATIVGVPVWPRADEAALRRLAAAGHTGRWTLRWGAKPAASTPASAPDESMVHRAPPPGLCASLPWPEPAQRAARALAGDPLRSRALADAAASLGTSPRSLQRTLRAAGLTWSEVVAQVRLRSAGWWLLETAQPIAEVGFLAGYADQPHFTRDFGRRIGLPPGRYRELFAQG